MTVDIQPSSQRPRAEILKTASHEPITMQSIVDQFGHTPTIGCENRADCQHVLLVGAAAVATNSAPLPQGVGRRVREMATGSGGSGSERRVSADRESNVSCAACARPLLSVCVR